MEHFKNDSDLICFLQKFMSYGDAINRVRLCDTYGTQTIYDKNDHVRGTINQCGNGYRFVYRNNVMVY